MRDSEVSAEAGLSAKEDEAVENRRESAKEATTKYVETDLGGVSAGALAAVGGARRETGVTLSADHLVAVVGLSKDTERGLDDTSTETFRVSSQRLALQQVNERAYFAASRAIELVDYEGSDEKYHAVSIQREYLPRRFTTRCPRKSIASIEADRV